MKHKNRSFFSLLIWNYIYFTAINAAIIFALVFLYVKIVDTAYLEARLEKLPGQEEKLKTGQYEAIRAEKIFGKEGYFEIVNQDGKIIYSSTDNGKAAYPAGEISCIQDYNSDDYFETVKYTALDGNTNYLLKLNTILDNDTIRENGFMVISASGRIIYNFNGLIKDAFTEGEISILLSENDGKFYIRKHIYQTADGGKNTLIMHVRQPDYKAAEKLEQILWYIIPVYIVFYIALIIAFVIILNRKVKIPLSMLNDALLDFAEGKREKKIYYNGPEEFVKICGSFNQMSSLLLTSEMEKEKLTKDKQKMLADISHDLKTPVTVIKGYAKAICDGVIAPEKVERYLNTIYQKADGLTDLINTFYEYNKLEHPDFQLLLEEKDICEELREYLALKYEDINISGFILEADIPDKKIICCFDSGQLRRVFENIMSNALKHNEAGTTIYLSLEEQEKSVRIIMADNGKGIPKELQNVIFDAFCVGDDSRNHKEGSGLGLAIVKRIITLHSGKIRLLVPPDIPYHTEFEIILSKAGRII